MSFENDLEDHPVRTVIKGGLITIGVVVAIGAAVWSAKALLYPVQQAGRVMERTLDADNMLRNYEWFKQQVQDVKAIDKRLATYRARLEAFVADAGPRDRWSFEDKQEVARLNAVIGGLEGQRAQMVADYNARTQMENRDLFRTNDLPEELH